jgi:hypothetical protein
MANFVYKPREEANWAKRANQSGNTYIGIIKDQFNTYGARKDENSIRIAPPTWDGATHHGYDVWVHYDASPEGGTVLCLNKMMRMACPICEFQLQAEAQGRDDASEFKPKRRVLVWVIDRKEEDKNENPMVWSMPWTLDRDISKICKDRESGEIYHIDHPTLGYDVYFDKTGEGETTKYSAPQLARRQSVIEDHYLDIIVNNPLPTVLLYRDYDEMKHLFEGNVPEKEKNAEPEQTQQVPPQAVQSDRPPRTEIQQPQAQQVQVQQPVPPTVPLVLTPPEFCNKSMKAGGRVWGCAFVGNHQGDCDFSRDLTNGSAPAVTAQPVVAQQTQPVVATVTAEPQAAGDGISRLKARFQTGPPK